MARRKASRSDLESLTRTQLIRLSSAFDQAADRAYKLKDGPSPNKRARIESPPIADQEGGGFIPSLVSVSAPQPVSAYDRIPFSYIASLLEQLDLPADQQVLDTFEHALSSDEEGSDDDGAQNKDTISKDHFLAVAAILVGDDDQDSDEKEASVQLDMQDSESEDVYQEDGGSDAASPARKPITRAARSKGKGKAKATEQIFDDNTELTDIEEDETEVKVSTKKSPFKPKGKRRGKYDAELTVDQKRNVSNTFASFFKPEERKNTDSKLIGFHNIRYVAGLLNYSLTDGDINEMLEQASSDTSMQVSLSAFEQIMRE